MELKGLDNLYELFRKKSRSMPFEWSAHFANEDQ